MTGIALLAACGPSTGVPTPIPSLDSQIVVQTAPGLRDLVAVGDFEPTAHTWSVEGVVTDLTGPVVPAGRLYPGETWTVEATDADGTTHGASHTVPEPLGGNVLVLLIDDVGVDKVGAYGWDTAGSTPNLDALAADGVRFTRAYASPVCSPTRGTLITSRMPRRTGLGWVADTGPRNIILPYETTTIPEALREARSAEAWSDGAIGKWHMAGPHAPGFLMHPNDSGFTWFVGPPGNPQYLPDRGYYAWSKNVNGVLEESTTYLTTDTVDEALERIEAMPEPWFLYVAFNAAHGPLNLPPEALVPSGLPPDDAPDEDRFDAVLEALDTEIGRLLDSVDPTVLANTTVLAIGDNGTSDAGVPNDVDLGRNKHTPYEGGIRVPFVVTGPHVAQPGRVSDTLLHVADVLPTVADLAGIPLTGPDGETLDVGEGVRLDGRSLLPHLLDPDAPGREWVYAEAVGNGPPPYAIDRRAVQTATHKLVRWNDADELYRLEGPHAWDHEVLETLTDEDTAALEQLTAILDAAPETWAYEGR